MLLQCEMDLVTKIIKYINYLHIIIDLEYHYKFCFVLSYTYLGLL